MMDSQWQSGSFSEFGRSTSPISPSSPTSPTPSDSEGEMAQLRKVAAASTVSLHYGAYLIHQQSITDQNLYHYREFRRQISKDKSF